MLDSLKLPEALRRRPFIFGLALVALVLLLLVLRVLLPAVSGAAVEEKRATGTVDSSAAVEPPPSAGKPTSNRVTTVATVSLPPPRTPLKDMFAELQARSSAGDVHAAVRLYREVNRCVLLRGVNWNYEVETNAALNAKTGDMSTEELQGYQAELDRISEGQQVLQRAKEVCAGATPDMIQSMVPTIRQAALLGDSDARACYLSRGPTIDARAFFDQPGMLEDYRRSIQGLIDSGLASGDWKVVDVLRDAYRSGSQSVLAGLVGNDPQKYYRYLKLYRMGSEEYRFDELDRELAAAAAQLTPGELGEADSWVSDVLPRFSGHSTDSAPSGWDPCTFPYE